MSTPIGGIDGNDGPDRHRSRPPPAGSSVSGVITVTASAVRQRRGGRRPVLLDGQPIGAEDQVGPVLLTWDTTIVANGAHTLTARVRDVAGNTSTTGGTNVTVTNAAGHDRSRRSAS